MTSAVINSVIVEDLIVAAFADAKAHVDAIVADRMQAVTGKLPLRTPRVRRRRLWSR